MWFALVAANSPVCLHPWWVDASIVRASLPSGKPKRHIRARPPRAPRPSQSTICRQPAVAKLLTIACQRKLTLLSVCSQGLLALGMFASGSSRRYAISETRAPIRRRQQTVIARHSWDDHRITERQPSSSNRRHPRLAVPRGLFPPAARRRGRPDRALADAPRSTPRWRCSRPSHGIRCSLRLRSRRGPVTGVGAANAGSPRPRPRPGRRVRAPPPGLPPGGRSGR